MKVKRSYAIELNQVLNRADKIFQAPIAGRFYYMVSKNTKATEEEVKLTMEAFPYDPKFLELEQKRIAILNEGGIYKDSDADKLSEEAKKALEDRIKKLRADNADVMQAEAAIDAERNKFLDEEIELNLKTIKFSEMPTIIAPDNWHVYHVIEPLIEDED